MILAEIFYLLCIIWLTMKYVNDRYVHILSNGLILYFGMQKLWFKMSYPYSVDKADEYVTIFLMHDNGWCCLWISGIQNLTQ